MKKILILLLAITVMLSSSLGLIAFGEEFNLAENGGFEILGSNGVPTGWTLSGGEIGEEFEIVGDAHSGENALKMKSDSGIFAAYAVTDLVGGEKYKISAFVKPVELEGNSFAVKVEVLGKNGHIGEGAKTFSNFGLKKGDEWQEINCEIELHEDATRLVVLLRSLTGAETHLDDLKVTGKIQEPTQESTFVDTIEGTPNLILNGDFEKLTAKGEAENWKVYKDDWNGLASIASDNERGNVLKLSTNDNSNPWGMYLLKDLPQGAEYQITTWIKTIRIAGNVRFKYEFYSENEVKSEYYIASSGSEKFVPTKGEWQQIAAQIKVPIGAKCLALYARMYGAGEMYYDDFEFKMVTPAPKIFIGSDAFVYSHWDEAEAYAQFNSDVYNYEENQKINFEFIDDGKVLDTFTSDVSEEVIYKFSSALLSEKAKKYIIRISYLDADGSIIETYDEPIYKYDRPTKLNDKGEFIGADGKPILPLFGYHVTSSSYDKCVEAGINVVQHYSAGTPQSILKALDVAQEKGLYLALNLYVGMKPAGHPDNVEHTVAVVNAVKHHPALFGYMVMDEPFMNNADGYEELRDSYKLFSDLDSEHPVYICECEERWLYKVATVVDILAIDPYPTSKPFAKHVSNFTRTAVRVTKDKPIYNILQSYELGGWEPTANDLRHMAYQALFAGSDALGYYPVADSDSIIWENALWEGVMSLHQLEYEDAYKAFTTKEYPTFSEMSNDLHDVWHKAFVKDGELYIILINRTYEDKAVSIPLVSGGVKIGDFTAVSADMNTYPEISGSEVFNLTLKPAEAVRYKITPTEAVDFSRLNENMFSDTENYPWASDDINRLATLGIVNSFENEFKPGEKITRADFAMFLIRTLGITSNETENFADIDPNAYYAKEIAAGKALNILQGVGDNNFNPDAEISRQDLMVICARGMEYAKILDKTEAYEELDMFSDGDKVADYAISSVSAMVREGIVVGNNDGTVNPLGNSTRAEAAVIMNRILNK